MRHCAKVCVSLGLCLASWAGEAWAQDAWPTRHHDPQRTGRSSLVGDIDTPVVAWERNTGGRIPDRASLVADLNGDGEVDFAALIGGAVLARRLDGRLLWDTPPLGLVELVGAGDLNGDGHAELLGRGSSFLLLDGATGRELWRTSGPGGAPLGSSSAQLLQADDDPALEVLLVFVDQGTLALHDFGRGFVGTEQWQRREEVFPIQVLRPVVGDCDGDGVRREVAFVNQQNCQAVRVGLADGRVLGTSAGLTRGLYCYGLTQAADLDGDGADELLFTGAAATNNGSVGVTAFDFGDNAPLWQHEHALNTSETISRAPAGAVGDLDGDGRPEVVTSVFHNVAEVGGQDDGIDEPGRWATAIYDGATGEAVDWRADRVAVGVLDLDGDGRAELITRQSLPQDVRTPLFARLEVWTLDGERALALYGDVSSAQVVGWERVEASISSRDVGFQPGTVPQGIRRDLLALRRGDEGVLEVQRLRLTPEGLAVEARLSVPPGSQVSLIGVPSARGSQAAALKTNQGLLQVVNADLQPLGTVPFTGFSASALVGRDRVLYRDSTGRLVALDASDASLISEAEVVWERAPQGEGGEFGWLDVDGDGVDEVAQAGLSLDGAPYVELLSGAGATRWTRPLEDSTTLPTSMVWGDFGGEPGPDLALLHRTLEGPQTITLDGRNGTLLQRRAPDEAEVNRSPNQQLLATDDQDADGLHDLLNLHFTTLERLSGDDLARLGGVIRFPASTSNPDRSALLAGREGTAVFLNLFTPRKALVDLVTGEVVWAVDAEPSLVRFAAQFPGQADANGDGALDVALGGRFGDLTVFDGVTGAVVRRSCLRGGEVSGLPEAASGVNCQEGLTLSSVAVADVDGDGLEEWVVGGSDGWLYAVRASDGERVWSLGLRYAVGDPAVADTDQDGRAEVLVATADSRLVLVDREALPPVAQAREVNLTGEDRILDPSVDIDISPRLDALGVAWEGQEGASSYVVTLLSENLNPVLEPVVVTGESHVFSGLSLLPGARYRASVTAVSEQGVSRPTLSDGVLIVRDGPDIVGFQARPNPFDPVAGEVTRLTGIAASPAGLESVQLDLWSLDAPAPEALVHVDFDPQGAQRYDLDWSWDGRDEVRVLPEGLYHAQLTVYDLDGAPISDFVTLQLDVEPPPQVEPDPEPEDDLGPEPDADAADVDAADMDAADADVDAADMDAADADEDAQELDAGGEAPEKEYIYIYEDEDDCCGCEVGGREVGGKLSAGLLVLAVGAVLSRRSRARGPQA